jgi:hypothetical protein
MIENKRYPIKMIPITPTIISILYLLPSLAIKSAKAKKKNKAENVKQISHGQLAIQRNSIGMYDKR